MGLSVSRAAPREISERDVLTLCDDGDLLLLRESVVHAAFEGVAIDRRVAQDIAAFEGGAFPTARVTRLPVWTSCALLLRVSGVLHFLEVNADGMRLIAFQARVAQRLARRETYALRRLQHVRTDETRSFFRQWTFELSQVLPIRWCDEDTLGSAEDVRSLEETLRRHATLHAAVQRMLELCDVKTSLDPAASPVDRSAQLAAALVVAVFEQLRLVEPVDAASSIRLLTPSSFATDTATRPSSEMLRFSPTNALGLEMRLV